MPDLQTRIHQLKIQASGDFEKGQNAEELYQTKVHYLGKKGELTSILKELGSLSPEERRPIGTLANQLKQELEACYELRLGSLKKDSIQKTLTSQNMDLTLPGFKFPRGYLHPITQVLDEMKDLFKRMGFDIYEGPEIETDYYNFEALNIPKNHPARDMQDTFYLSGLGDRESGIGSRDSLKTNPELRTPNPESLLLRTHTSPVQIHVMENHKPPIQMVAPGVVYRCDSDATHSPMFHQIEGLMVDRNINMAHLKGVIQVFLKEIFKSDIKVKFRPSYFPFTEPSAEVDIGCVMCDSKGCSVCKNSGWLEIMGCGMVDPNVFKSVGIDSEEYTGFAFGIGVERVAMLKYGISDIRLFFENNKRFLDQF